jgi:malate/lactate dehydrogenase
MFERFFIANVAYLLIFQKLCAIINAERNNHIFKEFIMPNIKPVTDLQNYNDVLRDIAVGEPVFLTENGKSRYVLIEMREYERQKAEFQLLSELMKADESVKARGWLTQEDVERELGLA